MEETMSPAGGDHSPAPLKVSAIIPVKNAAAVLSRCLESLMHSVPAPPDECIVVLDGSTDESEEIARRYGCRIIQFAKSHGPAYARNAGALAATGDLLLFLDSDVCVHPDTLARYRRRLETDPEAAAVFGAYDDEPASRTFLSQYRNLMNSYVHSTSRAEACTFWSACGMIRRQTLLDCGGFDENYRRPCIEDIELGARLVRGGAMIRLDAAIQSKHLKRWTLWGMLRTDILDRGIPWTELILQQRTMPNDLNVKDSQRLSVALSWLLAAAVSAAVLDAGAAIVLPLAGLLLVSMGGAWAETMPRGKGAALGTVSTAAYAVVSWLVGLPLLGTLLAAHSGALGLRAAAHSVAGPAARSVAGLLAACSAVVFSGASISKLPPHPALFVAAAVALWLAALNMGFYRYLASRRGWPFALAAVPLNFLYHFHNGVSFSAGALRCVVSRQRRTQREVTSLIPAARQTAGS